LWVCFVVSVAGTEPLPAGAAEIKTPRKPVATNYHGVKVTEDYVWLENFNDPEVRKWNEAQNQKTRALLDKLPARPEIEKRLKQFYAAAPADYSRLQARQGQIFALKSKPPLQQPVLVWFRSPNDVKAEKVVVDPN